MGRKSVKTLRRNFEGKNNACCPRLFEFAEGRRLE